MRLRISDFTEASLALFFEPVSFGTAIEASRLMISTTTISSMSVKPLRFFMRSPMCSRFMHQQFSYRFPHRARIGFLEISSIAISRYRGNLKKSDPCTMRESVRKLLVHESRTHGGAHEEPQRLHAHRADGRGADHKR